MKNEFVQLQTRRQFFGRAASGIVEASTAIRPSGVACVHTVASHWVAARNADITAGRSVIAA